jgi:hypothetical protein
MDRGRVVNLPILEQIQRAQRRLARGIPSGHHVPAPQIAHGIARAAQLDAVAVAFQNDGGGGDLIEGVADDLVAIATGREPDAGAVGHFPLLKAAGGIPREGVSPPHAGDRVVHDSIAGGTQDFDAEAIGPDDPISLHQIVLEPALLGG